MPSTLNLKEKASLFDGPTPPVTPSESKREEFFSQFGPDRASYFSKPNDPRSLVRSDALLPDWGVGAQFFNQPKSRAGPLPSGNILDYMKPHAPESSAQRRPTAGRSARQSSPHSTMSFEGKEWTVEPAVQGNGGLTNAIRATMNTEAGLEKYWVGTLGFPTDSLVEGRKKEIHEKLESEYEALTVFSSDKDMDGHYAHYCKMILWPVFHYQIPDHPKSKAYEDHSWKFYKQVNQDFADKVISSYKRGDIIWVHDYHLLLVPGMIRKKLPDAQIGFFLHTAFPSSEVFRCLSTRKELLEGMLGANLVAFQTREYAQHFLQTCARLLIVEATTEGVQLEDRFVNVIYQSIGIDPDAMTLARNDPDVQEWISVLQERYKGKRLIVARDKLDHIRGVRQKLLAFELFLNKYPEWRNNVVLLQVATSTTENSELLATVSDIHTRIDSVHSNLAHQPLVFLQQDISFSQYLALLTVADALMITSLREGMNLTPHEFIICQDGKATEQRYGPVILSEFTGSAAILGDGVISVNPWDYQNTAESIKRALEMSGEEKERRYNKLRRIVLHQTGVYWAERLMTQLEEVHNEQFKRHALSIPRLNVSNLVEKYKSAERRLFILDYEGTLASYGPDSSVVLTSPQRVLDTLNDVLSDRKNMVYVMSARKPEEVQRLFHQVPSIGLIAENGCFLREYGVPETDWIAFLDLEKQEKWKHEVRGVLQYYADRIEYSWVEERHCSLVLHYEKSPDMESARAQAGDCANHINDSCDMYRVHAVPVEHALLIEPMDWSKGSAATHIFDRLREKNVEGNGMKMPDWVFVAGDDREDEVIFRWANEKGRSGLFKNVTTVSVGKRNTEAETTLTQGTTGLITTLQKLARASADDSSNSPDYFSGRKSAIDAA
ncbi:Trehalose-6-P synthase/phosphatase complex subunit [Taxawa tesnikishii (nom. ined.)]|nr:Trehalose-6-P synthase/phosphatase complex subunit [Dothideales sp. JES 119]